MEHYLCTSCGIQYSESAGPPPFCRICADERQPSPVRGQSWTTPTQLAATHRIRVYQKESGLFQIRTEPSFAIGQCAYLLQTNEGNVLWDCLSVLDHHATERLMNLGGVQRIALSHPHFYGAAVDWSRTFGNAPVYIHHRDRNWVVRPDPRVELWKGEQLRLTSSVSVVRCGGHFPGSCVLHWPDGADGRGVLLVSDTAYVCPDELWLSFMYSYPNYIPLPASTIAAIRNRIRKLAFDRIYGAFAPSVQQDARSVVERSAARYIASLRGARRRPKA